MIKDILLGQIKASMPPGVYRMGIEAWIKGHSEEVVTQEAVKVFNALGYALENSGVFVSAQNGQETASQITDVQSVSLPL